MLSEARINPASSSIIGRALPRNRAAGWLGSGFGHGSLEDSRCRTSLLAWRTRRDRRESACSRRLASGGCASWGGRGVRLGRLAVRPCLWFGGPQRTGEYVLAPDESGAAAASLLARGGSQRQPIRPGGELAPGRTPGCRPELQGPARSLRSLDRIAKRSGTECFWGVNPLGLSRMLTSLAKRRSGRQELRCYSSSSVGPRPPRGLGRACDPHGFRRDRCDRNPPRPDDREVGSCLQENSDRTRGADHFEPLECASALANARVRRQAARAFAVETWSRIPWGTSASILGGSLANCSWLTTRDSWERSKDVREPRL
jgi:hypothetical protein